MRHLLATHSLKKEQIYNLFSLANTLEQSTQLIESQLFVGNLFLEPSTRTKTSFTIAQKKLGMEILDFSAATSSMSKGETLYDTVKTFEAIGANMLVIRHASDDWMDDIAPYVKLPIINAGAGKAEHPTQSLLDAYTIHKEFNTFEGLNIVITGDIKYSRVAHSNINLLQKLGANIFLSAPDELIDHSLDLPHLTIDEAVDMADCLMLLRVQHERHEAMLTMNNYLELYGLTLAREKRMKDGAIIMHPAPVNRGVEIAHELVECERSRIFQQMTYGVFIRMAIMKQLLVNWELIK